MGLRESAAILFLPMPLLNDILLYAIQETHKLTFSKARCYASLAAYDFPMKNRWPSHRYHAVRLNICCSFQSFLSVLCRLSSYPQKLMTDILFTFLLFSLVHRIYRKEFSYFRGNSNRIYERSSLIK